MRLLDVKTLELRHFPDETKLPKYVIASHRWAEDETTFEDVQEKRNKTSTGFQKVESFARYVRENLPSVEWLWIDTCCIDKRNATELLRAINSMFLWYRNAELCIARLASITTQTSDVGRDEWFSRGWTLQELLAPRLVVFVGEDWKVLGNKGSSFHPCDGIEVGPDLTREIARITGIPERVLMDWGASIDIAIEDKMSWMNGRSTTEEVDRWYALFGIVGVTPGMNYGESGDSARVRLLVAIRQRDELNIRQNDESAERQRIEAERRVQYRKITDWLNPSNPWTNHETARKAHEAHTGEWLLQTEAYRMWKSGHEKYRHLWLYGKAGCGKTVLCSTAIEDMKTYCQGKENIGHAIFYFSFSDKRKQTYEDLLVSLVAQLGYKDPAFSTLKQMFHKMNARSPGQDELEMVLNEALASYDQVFCHLDALDECPDGDTRLHITEGIERLLGQATNTHLIATSRDEPSIRDFMERLDVTSVSLTAKVVDSDIQRYISRQLARIPKLCRLDNATKTLVEDTLTQKADGMFRWVFCQLQELSKSKRTNSNAVKAALLALPTTLDQTYERMLQNIAPEDQRYALTLLQWLAYAQTPLSLGELVEVSIIEPSEDDHADDLVDFDNRGGWGDALDVLAGLVVTVGNSNQDDVDEDLALDERELDTHTKVRLAHFSVKEYLESARIASSTAKEFKLEPGRDHRWITQGCLVYLMHYSTSEQKSSTEQDLSIFPLLEYAARYWYRHALLGQSSNCEREERFLESDSYRSDWHEIHEPNRSWRPFEVRRNYQLGPSLYYAACIGLVGLVQTLLDHGTDVNVQGGVYGNALQAAALQAADLATLLLDRGADVNAQGGYFGNALQAASWRGHTDLATLLIERGADVNAQGGYYGNALHAASEEGHMDVAILLLERGADVNAQCGDHGNALQAASWKGHMDVAILLLERGADVNAQGGDYGNALQAASKKGHIDVAILLLERGADVNAQGGTCGNALQAACYSGNTDLPTLLLGRGADVNAQGGFCGNALQVASGRGHEKLVQIFLAAGADVNAQGGYFGNALQAASANGEEKTVQILLAAGADVNAQGGEYGNALQAASAAGHEKVVQILLAAGADVNAQGGKFGTALQAASADSNEKMVQMLLAAGAVDTVKEDGRLDEDKSHS